MSRINDRVEPTEQVQSPVSQALNPQPLDLESWETSVNLARVNKSLSAVLLSLCVHLALLLIKTHNKISEFAPEATLHPLFGLINKRNPKLRHYS